MCWGGRQPDRSAATGRGGHRGRCRARRLRQFPAEADHAARSPSWPPASAPARR